MDITFTKTKNTQKFIYTVLILTLVWASLFAQDVNEATAYMSLGKQNGFSVEIDDIDKKNAEESWKVYIKEQKYGKVKRNKRADEWYGEGLKIDKLKPNTPISAYSKIEQKGKDAIFTVWVDLDGVFVSTNETPDEALKLTNMMEDFYLFAQKRKLNDRLKREKKSLKGENKRLKKLEKRHKKLVKSIEKNEDKISKTEIEVETAKNDKVVQIESVERARAMLQEAYDSDASKDVIKTQKKALKKAEKNLDKIKGKIRSRKDDITKMQRTIEDNKEEIEDNLREQESQTAKIAEQQERVKEVEEKIASLGE